MKNKKVSIALIAVLAIAIICICVYRYMELRKISADVFPSNTVINGVDCSHLSPEEAVSKLTSTWNCNQFVIKNDDHTMLTISDMDFTYNILGKVKDVQKRSVKYPFMTNLWHWNSNVSIDMTPTSATDNYNDQIATLQIFDDSNDVKTSNAHLDMSNTDFNIVPEVYGTNIDRATFDNKIFNLIAKGKWELKYNKKDFYVVPTVKSDSKDLIEQQKYAKKYLSFIIAYDFGDETRVITPAEISRMATYDKDGVATINSDEVAGFVQELADAYNTLGQAITFNSTAHGPVTVKGGTYGYRINQENEVEKLTQELTKRETVTREPEYSQTARSRHNGGVGSTYIEIDIASQHLWYYKDGQVILSTDVVTGSILGNTTTVKGAYTLLYKDHEATLKGRNADGTDYEADVTYWMPFYKGYGLHDAPWRSRFGGDIYVNGGSHGCVNMPVGSAASLFNSVSPGCPVIVF